MRRKRWEFFTRDNQLAGQISSELKISEITAQVLINRGIRTVEEARTFFQLDVENFWDSFLLNGMEKAVERLLLAFQDQEKIIIFGDYDVDGITATSLLLRVFRQINKNVDYYIPDRSEGYGLNKEAIKRLVDGGYTVLVTVDNGISCYEEVELANSLGMDVIITDHHEPPAVIPPAYVVINPKLKDSSYPYPYLAGVGVGFKLCQGIAKKLRVKALDNYLLTQLDLVALGTVADIVPLLGENRIIVANGLKMLERTLNPGLQELIKISGLEDKTLNAGHLGFGLGPRVNAIGRLDNPMLGVELFTTESLERAQELAILLDQTNRKRQMIEEHIFNQAVEMVEEHGYSKDYGIVLASDEWHPGVIGIVASKLVEKYYRPTIMIGIKDGIGKGSARSINGLNLYEALTHCQDYLSGYGGHEMAAGLSIKPEQIEGFRKAFHTYASSVLTPEDLVPCLKVDLEIDLLTIDFPLLAELEQLEPHGQGNARPVLAVRDVNHTGRTVGATGDHLQLQVFKDQKQVRGIGFGMGSLLKDLQGVPTIDLAFTLNRNIWQDKEYLQMMLIDLVPIEEESSEKVLSSLNETQRDIVHEARGCQVSSRLTKYNKFAEIPVKEVWQYISNYYSIQSDYLDSKHSGQTLTYNVCDLEMLPYVIYQAINNAIQHQGITCVLYPLRMDLSLDHRLIERIVKPLGLNVLKVYGSLTLGEKRELMNKLKGNSAETIDIILATPEYLENHADIFKMVLEQICTVIVQEVTLFWKFKWAKETLLTLVRSLDVQSLYCYTRSSVEELAEEIVEDLRIDHLEQSKRDRLNNLRISDQRGNVQKIEYLQKLLKREERTVIFVNTVRRSQELTKQLKGLIPNMQNQICAYHHELSLEECQRIKKQFSGGDGIKVIVATNCLRECWDLGEIVHVIHYDLVLSYKAFLECSQMVGFREEGAWIHLLYNETDYRENANYLDNRIPDRELLVQVYRFLTKVQDQTGLINYSLTGLLSEMRKQIQQNLEMGLIIEVLAIFQELSLIEIVQSKQKNVENNGLRLCPKPHQKLDLHSSIRYNECITERMEFTAFSEMALKETAETILQMLCRTGVPERQVKEA